MDDQELPPYIQLVVELERCPNTEVSDVLLADARLLNTNLSYLISSEIKNLQREREKESVVNLEKAKTQLEKIIEIRHLLSETFRCVIENKHLHEPIHKLLIESKEIINEKSLTSLSPALSTLFVTDDVEIRQTIADVALTFSKTILEFSSSHPDISVELSIAAAEQSLTVFKQDEIPYKWAETLNVLGIAYSRRICGDRRENVERAIDSYQKVLTVITKTENRDNWADTINNLASSYVVRIEGNHAENLEKAVNYYHQSLTAICKDEAPVEWAKTTSNLANAYRKRIQGERVENIEEAIKYLQQVLAVFPRDEMPIEWAHTAHSIACTYGTRILGDHDENIRTAIDYLQKALTVTPKDKMPVEWALMMNDLSVMYWEPVRKKEELIYLGLLPEKLADNIEKSIEYAQEALTVFTRDEMPSEWAQGMHNVSIGYLHRQQGNRSENIELAIFGLEESLTVIASISTVEWAKTAVELAEAYYMRVEGNKRENTEKAKDILQQGLLVFEKTNAC